MKRETPYQVKNVIKLVILCMLIQNGIIKASFRFVDISLGAVNSINVLFTMELYHCGCSVDMYKYFYYLILQVNKQLCIFPVHKEKSTPESGTT